MANSKRKCANCGKYFAQDLETWRKAPAGWFHNLDCQVEKAIKLRDNARKRERARAKKDKPKKLDQKGLAHHWKLTSDVMQKYAKLRDLHYNRPCISCGKHHRSTYARNGNMPTGGHYKTKGANKALQFNLWNIHFEHLSCNSFDADHLVGMRENLLKRIGKDKLEFLESNPPMNPKWRDKNYLKRMRKIFNKRLKRYEH